jgi:cell division septum initiation protein DivIVA
VDVQNETKNLLLLTPDEQRQYDALMAALHGGVKRDTLPNDSREISIEEEFEEELAIQKRAENSPILKRFWNLEVDYVQDNP